jgi:hypothetical protein
MNTISNEEDSMSTIRLHWELRRTLQVVTWPFRAIWDFSHWVRHSLDESNAIYGTYANDLYSAFDNVRPSEETSRRSSAR